MSTPEYRLAPAKNPAVGMGLYTRRAYHKSELIFTERPLVRVPYRSSQPFMKQLWKHVANGISSHPIVDAFKHLSQHDQKDFLRLHNARRKLLTRADYYLPNLDTGERISGPTCAFELLGIYLTNFFFLHEDLTGVFKSISRINHACAANAYLAWDRTNSEMRVVAASSIISAGTEITIDYSEKFAKQGMFKMLENIREYCRYFYGFWCRCNFCLVNLSQGSIQEITPQQEREIISFHLDEVEEKLLLRQELRCWEIRELWPGDSPASSRDIRSMGEVGMFATRRISRGEPIHGESPIFTLELHPDQLKDPYFPSVVKMVQDLDSADRDAYLALRTRDPRLSEYSFSHHSSSFEVNRLKEIFISNAICLPTCCEKEGYCEWGIFQDLSRVNHSCMPNSIGLTYNRKLRGTGQCQHWLHARRDIEPGEEITLCYVEALCTEVDVTLRASVLKDRFVCWCQRCINGKKGTSWQQHDTHFDYENEIPEDHPKVWVERINALPVVIGDQNVGQLRPRREKKKAIQPPLSLVSDDAPIELNKASKQEKVLCCVKDAGKRIGNGICSLPFVLDNARQTVLNVGRRKTSRNRSNEVLKRRIQFTDSSGALEDGIISQPGESKGKCVSSGPPSTDWATMSAIILRDNYDEGGWGFGGMEYPFHKLKAIRWGQSLPLWS
ncbi:hypothetical protein Q9L58_004407 [Maublancomyces gigas]|uniref:SET domain-containing protein n=1 Tax=Discina gigas TaxID=1032678 RepID=A0ABR3GKW7_9PEZI